jgi:polyphosphate kinase
VRLTEPEHLSEINSLFDRAMDDRTSSWHLDGEGVWTRRSVDESGHPLDDLQTKLMQQIGQRTRTGKRR